jgi:methionyl-tRNA synthetase
VKPYYVTTPIYYVTDAPHIGHLYCTLATDIMARFQRLRGNEVWFLTGTDEHGQKIEKKAKENKETPQQLADRVVERYRDCWKVYGVENDDFIRTSEPRHKKVVQEYVARLMKTGDIYLGSYEGWYCVPDETYWTETQLVDGKCPDCGRPVERLQEESYFFRMSAYEKKLLAHIEANPNFIVPESRRNEVLGFIRQGLKDISISRTTIEWGIPMPADPKATKTHKVYVWFDALTNYISALGPLDNDPKFEKFWPAAIHVVGKDILRFHAVYWPTFLLALGISLPKQIVAHGWLTLSNKKIGKSLGNAIEPVALSKTIGVDGMRYFLFREFVFGLDGEYSEETLYTRVNSDLANDYGNCVSRVGAMILKYFGETPLELTASLKEDSPVRVACLEAPGKVVDSMEQWSFHKALEAIWKIVSEVNKFIDASAPWALAKSEAPADKERLKTVLVHCHEALRISSIWLHAFLPGSTKKALESLGALPPAGSDWLGSGAWAKGPAKVQVIKSPPLFPRLEWKKS